MGGPWPAWAEVGAFCPATALIGPLTLRRGRWPVSAHLSGGYAGLCLPRFSGERVLALWSLSTADLSRDPGGGWPEESQPSPLQGHCLEGNDTWLRPPDRSAVLSAAGSVRPPAPPSLPGVP